MVQIRVILDANDTNEADSVAMQSLTQSAYGGNCQAESRTGSPSPTFLFSFDVMAQ